MGLEISCENEDVQNLYYLRWLNGGKAQVYPGSGAELFDAQARYVNGGEQYERKDVELLFKAFKKCIVYLKYDKNAHEPHDVGRNLNDDASGKNHFHGGFCLGGQGL